MERPDFYIIVEDSWRKYLEDIKSKLKEIIEVRERVIPIWLDNWRGISLRPKDVKNIGRDGIF